MSKIRQNRLISDYKNLQALIASCYFKQSFIINIINVQGNPPEKYRIKISNCQGIESLKHNKPKYRTEHIITISDFPQDYPDPGQIPTVKAETPLFHPNVYSDGRFCFRGSDRNRLNQPLDTLIKRIVSMIQYENLRFGVPANSQAKTWANSNRHLFPLSVNSASVSPELQLRWR